MVSFNTAALLSLAVAGVFAGPVDKRDGLWHHQGSCLTPSDAQQVADNYEELIRSFTKKLANEALTVNFTDFSESVNTLINTCPQGSAAVTLPLLSPTFSSRAQFEEGQGQQQPINFHQLDIQFNCKSVTIRWKTTNTAPIPKPRPVVGIIVMLVEEAPAGSKFPWLIDTVYSEFDSGAWLQNLEQAGICSGTNAGSPTVPLPSGTVPATVSGSAPASGASTASAPAGSCACSCPVCPPTVSGTGFSMPYGRNSSMYTAPTAPYSYAPSSPVSSSAALSTYAAASSSVPAGMCTEFVDGQPQCPSAVVAPSTWVAKTTETCEETSTTTTAW